MSFGRLRERSENPRAEINMIPLIDVMLVLLVIFILTAPLVTQSVKLQLPEAVDLEEPVQLEEEEKPIMIAVNDEGELFVNEAPVDEAKLVEQLTELKPKAGEKSPMVQLHIDASVEYQKVAKIVTALSKVGLANIGFVSLPEEGGTE